MQSPPEKAFVMLKREATDFSGSSFASHLDNTFQGALDAPSASSSSSSDDDSQEIQNEDDLCNGDDSKQLVLYDPSANGTVASDSTPPGPTKCRTPPCPRISSPRVLPSVGAFTVQCANCFKWRLIPTKEKYEEIREHILENPFLCETAREWRPDISCDDPTDITQDGSRLWAIDKPNIAQPPPGWQRLLRIRGEGSTKFADIYYQAPSGKRLRSMVEVQKYLMEHPEYATEGVNMSRFSFQIPKPLQEDYVRKRPARLTSSHSEVSPLAWAGPDERELQHPRPALPAPSVEAPISDSLDRPAAKKAKRTPSEQMYRSSLLSNQHGGKVEKSVQSRNTS